MAIKEVILLGRDAVKKYQDAHKLLHSKGWYKGISEDHTPLLRQLEEDLGKCGFKSLCEFEVADIEQRIADGEEII